MFALVRCATGTVTVISTLPGSHMQQISRIKQSFLRCQSEINCTRIVLVFGWADVGYIYWCFLTFSDLCCLIQWTTVSILFVQFLFHSFLKNSHLFSSNHTYWLLSLDSWQKLQSKVPFGYMYWKMYLTCTFISCTTLLTLTCD